MGLYLLVLNHPSLCSELFFSTFTSCLKSIFGLMLTSAFVVTFNSVYFQLVFLHHRFFPLYLFALKRQPKSNQKGV